MKLLSKYAVLGAALTALGACAVIASASAEQSDSSSPSASAPDTATAPGRHWRRWQRRPMMVGLLLRAAHDAGIPINRASVRGCLAQLRGQAQGGSPPTTTAFTVLNDLAAGNTSGYSADVSSLAGEAAARAQNRIQRESELTQCVYTAMALNPAQASALANEIEQLQTKLQQRRAARSGGSSG